MKLNPYTIVVLGVSIAVTYFFAIYGALCFFAGHS